MTLAKAQNPDKFIVDGHFKRLNEGFDNVT